VTTSTASTNAGVPLTVTVRARKSDGSTDAGYRGTVKFTATDGTFAPGTLYSYQFTAADTGQHDFPATFNTAGAAQTITATDTSTSTINGTSPAVNVAETYLRATVNTGTVAQWNNVNLTVEARTAANGGGTLVTGYQGRIQLGASNNSLW